MLLEDPNELLALEGRAGAGACFADLDGLLADLVVRSLMGDRIVRVELRRPSDGLTFERITDEHRRLLADVYLLAHQRARGTWFIPEKATVKAGMMNFPATFAAQPRFASGLVDDGRARVALGESPDALFAWAVLEHFFEVLFTPFELRGRLAGIKSPHEQLAAWAAYDEMLASLGLALDQEVAIMRLGSGWGHLQATEQLAVKQRVIAALASQATCELARRYRAYRLFPLIARYYEKATDGRALKKYVLNRSLEKTLSGFFGGDWLAFLAYLGEVPHPDEEIVVALPETKLLVGRPNTASTIATEKGLPAAEVERILASFWQTTSRQLTSVASPVEERVAVLVRFWQVFDQLHAQQTTGMRSLWGLVEDSREIRVGWEGPDWYHPSLYEQLLPADLNRDVERLWGSIMLPQWPDRIVTEIMPHSLMAETFGAALRFWHGCSLTAWFICEGPMSRTTIAGLGTYHQKELAVLQHLGCPIDPALFAELQEAEHNLGPATPLSEEIINKETARGISIVIRTSSGSRRSGFEGLRDIITRYRRAWSKRHLSAYLERRWMTELHDAARVYAEAIAQRSKPPTAVQFARHAAMPINHWFGGDLEGFYVALGEKTPTRAHRVVVMPTARRAFAMAVFERLGGQPFKRRSTVVTSIAEQKQQLEQQERTGKLGWLAGQSLRYLQLQEASGHPPRLAEFGESSFAWRSSVLGSNLQAAWDQYTNVIRVVLATQTWNREDDAGLTSGSLRETHQRDLR